MSIRYTAHWVAASGGVLPTFKPYLAVDSNESIQGEKSMKKNVAGQHISAQMITLADGSDFNGTVTVTVRLDSGNQAAGLGTVTNKTNGEYDYAPTQAETNADFIVYSFSGAAALTRDRSVYTTFPQTGDNFARIGVAGASLTDLGGMSTGMKAEVQVESAAALAAIFLDHLMFTAVTDTDVADNSLMAKILSASGTADFSDFVNSTDSLPALAVAIGGLATGSSAISIQAESYVLTTGTETLGTVADTATVDLAYHEHTDTAGAMDLYYQFNVGGTGVAASVTFDGLINGGNDLITLYAYNWAGASWDVIGLLIGTNGTSQTELQPDLLVRHTGSGANLGLVRIRFFTAAGLTSATLKVDRIITSYAVVSQSVGYDGGQVWIDTINGSAGTEAFVNGTADNPCLTVADAIAVAAVVGLSRYFVISGSSVTLTSSHIDENWDGQNWELALGGQDISRTIFHGATAAGIAIGTSPQFEHCEMGDVTLPPCRINGSTGFSGTLTAGSAGDYNIIDCVSLASGVSAPIIDCNAAVGATTFNLSGWAGAIDFTNIGVGDNVTVEGIGGVISVNGVGGNALIRGIFEEVIDNSGALVSLTEIGMLNRRSLAGYENGSVWIDTLLGSAGVVAYVNGTSDNAVDTLADAIVIAGLVGEYGINSYSLGKGSSIVLSQAFTGTTFAGDGGTIDLNGQDIGLATFIGLVASGVGAGTARTFWRDARMNALSLNTFVAVDCSFNSTITLTGAAQYSLIDCFSTNQAAPPMFDFGGAVGSSTMMITDFNGELEFQNMGQLGTDEVLITGSGILTINANCVAGSIRISGSWTVINNGTTTVVRDQITQGVVNLEAGVNVAKVNDTVIIGDGSSGSDLFRSTLEP
jgi:hypothetical protein